MSKKLLTFIIVAIFLYEFASPLLADAHRLNVFAWIENNNIIVESNFAANRPAKNAKVIISDLLTGKEILLGNTDEKGQFISPLPNEGKKANGLKIIVNASQGHQNEWKIEAEELSDTKTATISQPKPQNIIINESENTKSPDLAELKEELRLIIREELNKKTNMDHAASMVSQEPGIKEIIGGIGWIIGLAGIFLWIRSRQQYKNGN